MSALFATARITSKGIRNTHGGGANKRDGDKTLTSRKKLAEQFDSVGQYIRVHN